MDAKGKGTSGGTVSAESTDAPTRGGLLRIKAKKRGNARVERRGQVTDVGVDRSTGNGRNRLGLTEGGSLHAVARAG